jgi:glutamate 5-kinase
MLEKILVYDKKSKQVFEADAEYYPRDFSKAKNIIIKAGTDVLTANGDLDLETMQNICYQMVYLLRKGVRVTYVTSAAIATGRRYVGEKASKLSKRSLSIAGQPRLMREYNKLFDVYKDIKVGQVLLEAADFDPKHRNETKEGFDGFYNECNGLAIVNANDATWKGEIEADNDRLQAWLYKLLNADLSIILSAVDGLMYNYGKENQRVINYINPINEYILNLAKGKNSSSTTGGMEAKLRGIKLITRENGKAVICNGKKHNIILDVLDGKIEGTYFG